MLFAVSNDCETALNEIVKLVEEDNGAAMLVVSEEVLGVLPEILNAHVIVTVSVGHI
jgi:hypothetical protein